MLFITNRVMRITNQQPSLLVEGTDDFANELGFWEEQITVEPAKYDATAFLARVKELGKPVLIFVHGFNVALDKALHTQQLIADKLVDHTVVLFAWPSLGNVAAYELDRPRAKQSGAALLHALMLLPGASLMCHSMGNYVLQSAIDTAKHSVGSANVHIDKLFMVAADVNNTLLSDSDIPKVAQRGNVFFCMNDGALDGSSLLHLITFDGLPRLGCVGPLHTPPNFSTFNCTGQLAHVVDPIHKHGAYFSEDWFYTIVENAFKG